jgi:hypothetical protein
VTAPDDVQVIAVDDGGDPTVVYVPGSDLAPLTARVGVLEVNDAAQDGRLDALEAISGGPVNLAYTHEQTTPSSVWVIEHGLSFRPGGVEVVDHLGNPHHPTVSYPTAGSVQLGFTSDVRGVVRLS